MKKTRQTKPASKKATEAKEAVKNLPFDYVADEVGKEFNKADRVLGGRFAKGNSFIFQPNNKLHELRTRFNEKHIESPEILGQLFLMYMQEIDDNPWIKIDFKGKDADKVEIPLQKPYTWNGFDNYLYFNGIVKNLNDYKENKNGSYGEFSEILERIGKIIYDHKFTGATVGAFNAGIIARELGLTDKKELSVGLIQETKIGFE